MSFEITRRFMLKSSVFALGATASGCTAQAVVPARSEAIEIVPDSRDVFQYEVTRTNSEWQALLGRDYRILRQGGTELEFSHPYHELNEAGRYHCKGCGLEQYTSNAKAFPGKGFAFFTVGVANAQLLSPEQRNPRSDNTDADAFKIEAHCRRCGSHLGHILPVGDLPLHCINGSSLVFEALSA